MKREKRHRIQDDGALKCREKGREDREAIVLDEDGQGPSFHVRW